MTGSEIRALRRAAGLTQTQLAERMGLGVRGQRTISEWERARHAISEPHARLLAILCQRKEE